MLDNNLINNEPALDDPYYSEWAEYQADQEEELEEVAEEEPEEEEEITVEQVLSITGKAAKVFNTKKQQAMMAALIGDTKAFDAYSKLELDGGVYNEVLVMDGGEMKDNFKAYRSMSNSSSYDKMFKSQYKN